VRIPLAGHLGTKLMALILGIALWGFAFMQNLKETSITYRVHFYPPEGFVASPEDKTITVKVRGPRRVVDTIKPNADIEKPLEVNGEVQDYKDVFVSITPEDLGTQSGLVYLQMPPAVEVTLTKYDTRSLAVELQPTGSPLEGYALSKERTRIWPATVSVTGPKRLLDAAASINTEPINLAGRSGTETLPLANVEDSINGEKVTVTPSQVAVELAFDRKTITRDFESVPVQRMLPPGAWPYAVRLDPATVTVTVEGPDTTVTTLEPEDVSVYVRMEADDLPRATGGYSKPAVVIVPRGVTGKAAPENINVEVSALQP
jgi:YbbR domain-containing protein